MKDNTKPNKAKAVAELILLIEKGYDRATCLSKVIKKWQVSTRTFDRRWKTANEECQKRQEVAMKRLLDVKVAKEAEALEVVLNDKNAHAKELLQEIVRLREITAGKAIRVGGNVIIATFSDEIRAKAEIRNIRKQIGEWYGFKNSQELPKDDTEAFEGFDAFMAECKKIQLTEDEE